MPDSATPLKILVVASVLLLGATTSHAQQSLRIIAQEGDVVAGTSEPIAGILGLNATLADDGTAVFPVFLSDFSGIDAVVVHDGSTSAVLLNSGDSVPGVPGATFDLGGYQFFAGTSGDGLVSVQATFQGATSAPTSGILLDRGAGLELTAIDSVKVADTQGYGPLRIGRVTPSSRLWPMNADRVAFAAPLIESSSGFPQRVGGGVFVAGPNPGQLTTLMLGVIGLFEPISLPGTTLEALDVGNGLAINRNAQVAFVGLGQDDSRNYYSVLYRWDGSGDPVPLLQGRQFVGHPEELRIEKLTLNAAGQVAFYGKVPGRSEEGVWVAQTDGTLNLAVAVGQAAPGTGGAFTKIQGLVLTEDGRVAVLARIEGDTNGIWIEAIPGDLRKMVVHGDPATGLPAGNQFGGSTGIGNMVVNGDGLVAFSAELEGPDVGFGNDDGVWMGDLDGYSLVVRTGDQIQYAPNRSSQLQTINMLGSPLGSVIGFEGPGNGYGGDGIPSVINASGDLLLQLSLSNSELLVVVSSGLVVNTTGDAADLSPGDGVCDTGGPSVQGSPECSLRAAMQEANASVDVADKITFEIPGSGPFVIQVGAALPVITDQVTIDGPGAGAPEVVVDGTQAGPGVNGFRISLEGGRSEIRDLSIVRFEGHGILLENASDVVIRNNFIGLDPAGNLAGNGSDGIHLENSTTNDIGGSESSDRNVVSGNAGNGVTLSGELSSLNTISMNYVGTSPDGTSARSNGQHGISLSAGARQNDIVDNLISGNLGSGVVIEGGAVARSESNKLMRNTVGLVRDGSSALGNGRFGVEIINALTTKVGGPETAGSGMVREMGNVISANDSAGVLVRGSDARGTVVQGNIIGRDATGQTARGNLMAGILIRDGRDSQIGGSQQAANLIASNGGSGVAVEGGSASGNEIRHNQIFDNDSLDIDLGNDLVSPNDLGDLVNNVDADAGPNTLLNFPVGVTGFQFSDLFRVTGVLNSVDPTRVIVDVYSVHEPNSLGYGGGETWLGEATPDSAGVFVLDLIETPDSPFLSALATDAQGNTSEFSPVCGDPDGDGNPDSDGDGLCDEWEGPNGIDYNGDGQVDLDLLAEGASASHKDLFLEADWMTDASHSHEPSLESFGIVTSAFGRSPVDNPDGSTGVALHIVKDESVPEITPLLFNPQRDVAVAPAGSFDDLKMGNPVNPCGGGPDDGHFGTLADRLSDNCAAILGARRLVYRYVIFGHDHAHNPGSGGTSEIRGNDFAVTLGSWSEPSLLRAGGFKADDVAREGPSTLLPVAKRRKEAAVLMHELGHTLGRRHGGDDNVNCKPNYPSVMNYMLSDYSMVPNRPQDYSAVEMPDLDELNLNESAGLQGPADRFVVFNQTMGLVGDVNNLRLQSTRTNQSPIDWDGRDRDGDGDASNDNPAASDINFVKASCGTPGASILRGSNDWSRLLYSFRFSADFGDGQRGGEGDIVDIPELTPADIADMADNFDFDGDGLVNSVDNCSAISNPDQVDLDRDGVGDVCEEASADLGLNVKASPDPGVRFSELTYTITMHNLGPSDATDVTVALEMDPAMTFVGSPSGTCTALGQLVGCSGGDIAVGDSAIVVAVVEPQELKTASVTATTASLELDPLPDNNTAVVDTEINTSVGVNDESGVPERFRLGAAYPNPFNPSSTIPFDVARNTHVTLTVFNVLGQRVRVLEDGVLAAGRYERVFNAGGLPSGLYVFSISMGEFRDVGKMVLVK